MKWKVDWEAPPRAPFKTIFVSAPWRARGLAGRERHLCQASVFNSP